MEPTKIGVPLKSRNAAIPFLAVGTVAIIFGGLFSAATARSASYHSAWFVAYLVLVVGVAQVALGLGQWWLTTKPIGAGFVAVELVLFNLGNAGVIFGTMTAKSLWVDLGSTLLFVSLILFGWSIRPPGRRRWALWGYRALIILLLVSVLIGLTFANVGAP